MNEAKLQASPRLTLFLLCAHAAAAVASWLAFGGAAGSAIGLLVMTAGAVAIRGPALLLARDSPAYLVLNAAGDLRIIDRNGLEWTPVADSACFVSRWVVIVPVSGRMGRRRRIPILGDMLSRERFRRLRIWALWGGAGAARGHGPDAGSVRTN
ncbi:MAG: hypothetical protein HY017_08090 [Betaproteobacteria bacterium]|nr:hypothetical protein [Betaproteobacteria bacterium]